MTKKSSKNLIILIITLIITLIFITQHLKAQSYINTASDVLACARKNTDTTKMKANFKNKTQKNMLYIEVTFPENTKLAGGLIYDMASRKTGLGFNNPDTSIQNINKIELYKLEKNSTIEPTNQIDSALKIVDKCAKKHIKNYKGIIIIK